MARLTTDKQSYISIASDFISKEEFATIMTLIQKRIDRIAKVQKAKNWKHNLTK